jgi:hypothetical protein
MLHAPSARAGSCSAGQRVLAPTRSCVGPVNALVRLALGRHPLSLARPRAARAARVAMQAAAASRPADAARADPNHVR